MNSFKLSYFIKKFGFGRLLGDDISVNNVSSLSKATANNISFFANKKYKQDLLLSKAGAIIIGENNLDIILDVNISKIVTSNPYLFYAKVSRFFNPIKQAIPGIDKTSIIGKFSNISSSCEIKSNVNIGDNVSIGDNSIILSGVSIGDNCQIGKNCIIHHNVSINHSTVIGNNVEINSGSVIGSEGFGFAQDKNSESFWVKVPQIGKVIIGNNVNIGSNTSIDRGSLDNTIIEDNVIIDNLVQIAHNCRIGSNTAIAACTGISGSTMIGSNCIIGGAVMMVGHIKIANGCIIGGGTGITKSILEENSHYASIMPLLKFDDWRKNIVYLKQLKELNSKIKQLENKVNILKDGV